MISITNPEDAVITIQFHASGIHITNIATNDIQNFGATSNIFNINFHKKSRKLFMRIQYGIDINIPDLYISSNEHRVVIMSYFVQQFSKRTLEYLYENNSELRNVISFIALCKTDKQNETHMSEICSKSLINELPGPQCGMFGI